MCVARPLRSKDLDSKARAVSPVEQFTLAAFVALVASVSEEAVRTSVAGGAKFRGESEYLLCKNKTNKELVIAR